jgi:threonine/homoserine/homoserine lactone efflux protein
MTLDIFLALSLFALVTSITPGPNNIMLLSSGMNYGFKRSIPHMLGIAVGFMLMIFLMGLGLDRLFNSYPILHLILRYCSGLYILWLAWKIANAAPLTQNSEEGKPMSFIQAAIFQWVNPKAWVMALSALVTYMPIEGNFWQLLGITLIFGAINLPCVSLWAGFGTGLRTLLTTPKSLQRFNFIMATLLVLSLLPLLH